MCTIYVLEKQRDGSHERDEVEAIKTGKQQCTVPRGSHGAGIAVTLETSGLFRCRIIWPLPIRLAWHTGQFACLHRLTNNFRRHSTLTSPLH